MRRRTFVAYVRIAGGELVQTHPRLAFNTARRAGLDVLRDECAGTWSPLRTPGPPDSRWHADHIEWWENDIDGRRASVRIAEVAS